MAYTFNGSTQYLSAGLSPIGTLASVTMACWVNGAAQDGRICFSLGSSSNNNSLVSLRAGSVSLGQTASHVRFFCRADANADAAGDINLSNGIAFDSTWRHIAGTYDGTTACLYVDGTQTASSTPTAFTTSGLDRLSISALLRAAVSLHWAGSQAENAIWTVALNAAEIASLAKGVTPDQVRPQSLVFYAPLVRNLIDVRGGLALTNNNGATVANHPRVYQ